MLSAQRRAIEVDEPAALQDAVEDGLGEVVVVQDVAPGFQGLVGGKEQGAWSEMAFVDEVVKDVGGVLTVGEVADLIDDEHVGTEVVGKGLAETAVVAVLGPLLDACRAR